MKKLMAIFYFITYLILNTSFAAANNDALNDLNLNVQFDSRSNKNFYDQPILMDKVIKIDPTLNKRNIISTQSTMMNNLPVTIALLIKVVKVKEAQITLQFDLMSYGFGRSSTLIAQPRMILKNSQIGEMQTGPYKLKVLANWNQKTKQQA